jgi:hypothetical protein
VSQFGDAMSKVGSQRRARRRRISRTVPARHAGQAGRARGGYSGATAPAGSRPTKGRGCPWRRDGGPGSLARKCGPAVDAVAWPGSGGDEDPAVAQAPAQATGAGGAGRAQEEH